MTNTFPFWFSLSVSSSSLIFACRLDKSSRGGLVWFGLLSKTQTIKLQRNRQNSFEILSIFQPLFALVVLLWEAAPFQRRFHDIPPILRAQGISGIFFFFVRLWPCFLRGSFLMSQFLDPSPFFLSFVGSNPRSSWVFRCE